MPSLAINCSAYFMKYKDNDIEWLKEIYSGLQCDLEQIRTYKENYICTCALRTIDADFELDEMNFVAFVDGIEETSLCCNCRYSFTKKQHSAAGEGFLDHDHPNFIEAIVLVSIVMIHGAIIGIEYGLKELTDHEIDTLCRENPNVDIESGRDFNSYFNELEL